MVLGFATAGGGFWLLKLIDLGGYLVLDEVCVTVWFAVGCVVWVYCVCFCLITCVCLLLYLWSCWFSLGVWFTYLLWLGMLFTLVCLICVCSLCFYYLLLCGLSV